MACCASQTMWVQQWTEQGGWGKGALKPYGPLSFMPAAQVFSYGQSVRDGLQAQRTPAGEIVMFR